MKVILFIRLRHFQHINENSCFDLGLPFVGGGDAF